MEELNKLRDYKIPPSKQYLERVRDVLLFCCFSGLQHSDVHNLRKSDIKTNHIEVTTVKTADDLVIELNNHSKAILEKYKDMPVFEQAVIGLTLEVDRADVGLSERSESGICTKSHGNFSVNL